MTWELVWKIVFIGFLVVFAGMAASVTMLGARDIKRLLSQLRDEERDS